MIRQTEPILSIMMKLDVERMVFIVGAGGSRPYDLPIGQELRERICKNPPSTFVQLLPGDRFRDNISHLSRQFANEFLDSGEGSIDRWLGFQEPSEERELLWQWGKQSIAHHLLPLEMRAVEARAVQTDWLQWISQAVFSKRAALPKSPLRIITFNYDRLIEAAFLMMFRNRWRCNHEVALQLFRQHVVVHHVYGSLLDSQLFDYIRSGEKRTQPMSPFDLAKVGSGIRIIPEERSDGVADSIDPEAVTAIERAEVLVFLGFGFDADNVLRIGLSPKRWADKVTKAAFATCYGASDAKRKGWQELMPWSVNWGAPGHGCLHFLDQTFY